MLINCGPQTKTCGHMPSVATLRSGLAWQASARLGPSVLSCHGGEAHASMTKSCKRVRCTPDDWWTWGLECRPPLVTDPWQGIGHVGPSAAVLSPFQSSVNLALHPFLPFRWWLSLHWSCRPVLHEGSGTLFGLDCGCIVIAFLLWSVTG